MLSFDKSFNSSSYFIIFIAVESCLPCTVIFQPFLFLGINYQVTLKTLTTYSNTVYLKISQPFFNIQEDIGITLQVWLDTILRCNLLKFLINLKKQQPLLCRKT